MKTKKEKYQKVGYYPGCALEGSGHAYNRSTKEVGKVLGLDMVEVENWNCCGAMEVKNVDPKIQTYLSSRVMSIAANEMGLDVIMAPCNGCYHNLKKAEYDLSHDELAVDVVDKLSRKAGHETYKAGQAETIHALDWIKETIGEEGLKERVKNSLSGIKIANYYGCMYTRPRHIFPEKDAGPGSESTLKPHFIATECPTCHTGLELHQIRAEKTLGVKTSVKILYFTQLLGMAMGLKPKKVGVQENISDSFSFLKEKVGRKVKEGKSCGTVESGKWVGAAKSAAGGEVIEVNTDLVNTPSIANDDPYGAGWMVILNPDDWDTAKGALSKGADVVAAYEAKMDADGFDGCA